MYPSDEILVNDLKEALKGVKNKHDFKRIEALISRAEKSEFNDYFGSHDMPQSVLLQELKLCSLDHLIPNIYEGKYDGTSAEADAWKNSPEGRETFAEFFRK